jgi:hypothetical protein
MKKKKGDKNMKREEITYWVKELVKFYKKKYGISTAREINQGLCVEFSEDLQSTLVENGLASKRVRLVSEDFLKSDECYDSKWVLKLIEEDYHSKLPKGITTKLLDKNETGYHFWTEVDGLFYDSECTKGVSNLFDLPFYKRYIKRIKEEDEVK